MKKYILFTIACLTAFGIIFLHEQYQENYFISLLYIALRILAIVGIIKLIINKRKEKQLKQQNHD
jgi:D-alanyl-lipoteichoic acid acyltransferase DltB (MBOAT superfamily)